MSDKFKHDYLILDEFGKKEILCMACGLTIKSRQEIESKKFAGKIIRELSQHPEYTELPVMLSDGNLAFIMLCSNCKFVEIGEQEAADITAQINRALRTQLLGEGKPIELIDEILNKTDRRVIRKAETFEVAKAMRGSL